MWEWVNNYSHVGMIAHPCPSFCVTILSQKKKCDTISYFFALVTWLSKYITTGQAGQALWPLTVTLGRWLNEMFEPHLHLRSWPDTDRERFDDSPVPSIIRCSPVCLHWSGAVYVEQYNADIAFWILEIRSLWSNAFLWVSTHFTVSTIIRRSGHGYEVILQ